MERARRGFNGVLRKLRFSGEFISNNADELLAIAHTEYVRALDKGVEIDDPIAWTIHCAWRRTQNLLTTLNSRPRMVSSEKLAELIDEAQPTPEQIAEDTDRHRKVQHALAELSKDEQALIYLVYFEDLSGREAGRRLGWSPSKALRCHRAALKNLKQSLGVDRLDELELPIGLAVWLALSSSHGVLDLPGGSEALAEKAVHAAGRTWARIQDLGRKIHLGGGSDAAGAVATSGGGRSVGACIAVAAACVAGAGAVGPGLGGVALFGGHDSGGQAAIPTPPRNDLKDMRSQTSEESPPVQPVAEKSGAEATSNPSPPRRLTSASTARSAESKQVQQQTDAFARAASEPAPSTPSSESASSSELASPPSSASTTPAAQAGKQFDAFK
jgi:RNA polymerase sigma factor (sigma-70 family)